MLLTIVTIVEDSSSNLRRIGVHRRHQAVVEVAILIQHVRSVENKDMMHCDGIIASIIPISLKIEVQQQR